MTAPDGSDFACFGNDGGDFITFAQDSDFVLDAFAFGSRVSP